MIKSRRYFMKNPVVKMSLQAFLVGGIIGVITQGIFTIYVMIVKDFGLAIPLSLLTVVALGGILTAVGIFGKLDKFGGMGVNIPICGLGSAITGMIIGGRAQGLPTGKAIVKGLAIPLKILGTAAAIGLVFALIKYFVL